MDYDKIKSDDLIDMLDDLEAKKNAASIKAIYKILNDRDDSEGDFWREVFYDSPEWILRIILSVRNPLTIHDVCLIQSDELFAEVLDTYNVDMDGVEGVIERFDEKPEEAERAKLILSRLTKIQLKTLFEFFKGSYQELGFKKLVSTMEPRRRE